MPIYNNIGQHRQLWNSWINENSIGDPLANGRMSTVVVKEKEVREGKVTESIKFLMSSNEGNKIKVDVWQHDWET